MRFALRMLRKSPGFTFAAVVTLALAIGANAVVFGIMDALILRPLNVPQSESLWGTKYGDDSGWQSYPNYRRSARSQPQLRGSGRFQYSPLQGWTQARIPPSPTALRPVETTSTCCGFSRILAASSTPPMSTAPTAPRISCSATRIGTAVSRTIAGVVGRVVQAEQASFHHHRCSAAGVPGNFVVYLSRFLYAHRQPGAGGWGEFLNARGNNRGVFEVFGHLKPGVTPAQAAADMNAVGAYLEKTYPKEFAHQDSSLAHEGLTSFDRPARAFVAGLMLLAGLILLAACANLGSLFAAHAADRSREVALRLALGSSRNRILRQLLTEAVLISLAGGALGLLGSVVLLRRLSTWQPFPGAPIHLPVSPDARLYVVALALALVSGFLFGIVPVRQVLRANPYEIVKAGSSGQAWAADDRPRRAARRADCDLCRAGHFFVGRGARTGALAAQQLRF